MLGSLAELLGKDLPKSSNSISPRDAGFSELNLLKKENDFLKLEVARGKNEIDKVRQSLIITTKKNEMLIKELSRFSVISEMTNQTFVKHFKETK